MGVVSDLRPFCFRRIGLIWLKGGISRAPFPFQFKSCESYNGRSPSFGAIPHGSLALGRRRLLSSSRWSDFADSPNASHPHPIRLFKKVLFSVHFNPACLSYLERLQASLLLRHLQRRSRILAPHVAFPLWLKTFLLGATWWVVI